MKKLSLFFSLWAIGALLALSSCDKETDTPKPALSISFLHGIAKGATVEIEEGESKTVEWIANKGGSNLKTFDVLINGTGRYVNFNNGNQKTLSGSERDRYQDKIDLSSEGTYVFRVTDNDGNTAETSVTIKRKAPDAGVHERTIILMGGQTNTTNGSFYNAHGHQTYTLAQAKANSALIDLVYYYGANNLATVAAPSNSQAQTMYNSSTSGIATWSVKNVTKFKLTTMSETAFNELKTSAGIDAQTSGAVDTDVKNLTLGKVFAFETANGKKGLALVSGLATGGTGSITLKIKFQK
ncbi:MAG: hypothetical protein ACK4ND_19335 [Cytophagaceae bacterium]